MGVKVTGLIETEAAIMRFDSTAKRRVFHALVDKAREVRDMAIKMAPVDEGDLEKAIKMRPENANRARDEFGRFTRLEVEVYIDMSAPATNRPGKTVGDYAYEVHEHVTPAGAKNLGPRSQAKQQSNGGVVVGGGFLVRAIDEVDQKIDLALAEALQEIF